VADSWRPAKRRSSPEDGTDFSSHATAASPDIAERDCHGVVVAGHAHHAGARAAKAGLKVIQGLRLGRDRQKNLAQISTVVGLAKQYPDVITIIVVGNEVLLRGKGHRYQNSEASHEPPLGRRS
jgi:exo-beta-1,3-glucanase (GH17 family)